MFSTNRNFAIRFTNVPSFAQCLYVCTSLFKYPRKIQPTKLPASRGTPRYVLHLRHTATVKFISQEEKAFSLKYSISRHCEKLQYAYICITNYINVTNIELYEVFHFKYPRFYPFSAPDIKINSCRRFSNVLSFYIQRGMD